MKKFLLLGLLCTSCLSVYSQNTRFKSDENPCKVTFDVDTTQPGDHLCHNMVRNTSAGTLKLLWKREDISVPPMWEPTVCDNVQCYSTFVKMPPAEYYNEVKKGGSMLTDMHVYDAGVPGSAYVKLTVFELDDTTSNITIDYLFNKESVGTKNLKSVNLRMYPNPASSAVTIDYNNGISRIEIFSVLGNKLLNYRTEPSKTYDISMLEDGMYFIRFITTEEKILRTLRLQKKSMRP